MEPTEAVKAEARLHPNGWVYAIDGHFGPDDPVPPASIKGAWLVNAAGDIVGDFVPNPNYRPAAPR